METNTQQERAKRLEQQAREYLMQSNDPIFTRYLQQLLPRIQRQPEYVEQLQAELDKSVEFWYQRQQINANRGRETGAESSVPQQSVPQEAAAGEQQTAGQSQTQPVGQFTMQQVQAPVTQAPAQKKQNAEYLVATIALSVVGGIAWYVFYERLDQRYFFICSFPGSGIDRRITDPQKASETGPDLFGYRHSGIISVDHDQYDFPT